VPLFITSREVNQVTILDLDGRIILSEGCQQLREAVAGSLSNGAKYLLLNLERVDHIDSSGLAELVSAFTTAASQSARLKLLHLTGKSLEIFHLTRVDSLMEIFSDEASAIASFK